MQERGVEVYHGLSLKVALVNRHRHKVPKQMNWTNWGFGGGIPRRGSHSGKKPEGLMLLEFLFFWIIKKIRNQDWFYRMEFSRGHFWFVIGLPNI